MRSLLIAATLFGVLFVSGASAVPAAAQIYAITTADALNVRDKPHGQIIGTLVSGTVVMIRRLAGDWAEIDYLNRADVIRTGWVSKKYLRVVRVGSIGERSYHTLDEADFWLDVTDAELHCMRGFSDGYRSCTVTVSFDIETDYDGDDTPTIDVECEAELTYSTADGFSFSRSESGSEMIYMNWRSESSSIDIEFIFFSVEPVVRVKLRDASCEINSVF